MDGKHLFRKKIERPGALASVGDFFIRPKSKIEPQGLYFFVERLPFNHVRE
jgi:hypothetical protein